MGLTNNSLICPRQLPTLFVQPTNWVRVEFSVVAVIVTYLYGKNILTTCRYSNCNKSADRRRHTMHFRITEIPTWIPNWHIVIIELLGSKLAMLVESISDRGDTVLEICGLHSSRNAAGDSGTMCHRNSAQRLFPQRPQTPGHLQHNLCR